MKKSDNFADKHRKQAKLIELFVAGSTARTAAPLVGF